MDQKVSHQVFVVTFSNTDRFSSLSLARWAVRSYQHMMRRNGILRASC